MPDKPFIIPVFIPHEGCPHRCVFCNQTAITGEKQSPDLARIKQIIDTHLTYLSKGRHPIQISFYGGTFLGLDDHIITALLNLAEKYIKKGTVHSIRFSTRPDSVTHEKLELMRDYQVKTVELGVQSMDNSVLDHSLRGHGKEDTEKAVHLLKSTGYETGIQMMTGLPGSTDANDLETAQNIISLEPDFVRIYPTLVIKGSPLEMMYRDGRYLPQDLQNCVELTKRLYLLFWKNNIPVIRMGLQASEELDNKSTTLAGPYHPAFGHLVFSSVFLDMARLLFKTEISDHEDKNAVLYVNPKNISKIRGLKNGNLDVLKSEFNLHTIRITGDDSLGPDAVRTDRRNLTMAELL